MRSSTVLIPRFKPLQLQCTKTVPAVYRTRRAYSSSKDAPNPRFLSEARAQIGKCIMFGLKPSQVAEAGVLLKQLAENWRELVAGTEGYLITRDGREAGWRKKVEWGEQDMMGHVNNVAYIRYAESGRCNWAMNFAQHIDPANREGWSEIISPRSSGLILRSIKVDYKFPLTYPDNITVLHKLREPLADQNPDSFTLDVLVLSEKHRRPAARCVEDLVYYDYKAQKKSPMKDFMERGLKETWRLQEEAKVYWGNKVVEIDGAVRRLEKESWDRPDAKEDFGSASL